MRRIWTELDRNLTFIIFKDQRSDLMLPVQAGFDPGSINFGLDRQSNLILHTPKHGNNK